MLDLNLPEITPKMAPLLLAQAGFIAGLAGSIHCVGMCGGLVISSTKTAKDHFLYQGGRLLGYLFLAFIVGSTGKGAKEYFSPLAHQIFSLLLAIFILYQGVAFFRNKSFHLSLPLPQSFQKMALKIKTILPTGPFYVGLCSFLLPCGLLYSVLSSLLLLESPYKAMFVISLFWAGSAPLLMLIPGGIKSGLLKIGISHQKALGLLFIFMGLTSIALKIRPIILNKTSPDHSEEQCH